MRIYKRCSRCGKRLDAGVKCPCYDRGRDRRGRGVRDEFYRSEEWGRARAEAVRRTFGLDILAWYERGELVTGFTVHHIVPLDEGWQLRTAPDNLIYLTEADHRHIHKLYETDYIGTSRYLCSLLARFDEEFKQYRR